MCRFQPFCYKLHLTNDKHYDMKHKIILLTLIFVISKHYSQTYRNIDSVFIYFNSNEFKLNENKEKQISVFFTKNKFEKYKESYFVVKGYTDEKASKKYNQILSEKRAKSVSDYLLKKKDLKDNEIRYSGQGIDEFTRIDSLQRRATIYFQTPIRGCGLYEKTVLQDTLNLDDIKWFKNVTKYYDVSSMIKHDMYAIDADENFLKTAGMISFQFQRETLQLEDLNSKIISVCIPVKENQKYDNEMVLWKSTIKNGNIRWEKISANIVYNKESNCYMCYLPCSVFDNKDGIQRINIDKNMPEVVYFSTFKNYHFIDVSMTDADFSAIIDKEKYQKFVFVIGELINPKQRYFTGKFIYKGETKVFKVELSKCQLKKYNNSIYYIQTPKTNYFIDDVEYNKKGFWQWVKNIFHKTKDTY